MDRIQLAEIAVEELFGFFSHTIRLHTSERITILHGPNGVGKTVILRLVYSFFEGRNDFLLETNFSELCLKLSNNVEMKIKRIQNLVDQDLSRPALEFRSSQAVGEVYQWVRDRAHERRLAEYIDSEVHEITRVGPETWTHDLSGEVFSVPDLIRAYRQILPSRMKANLNDDPAWLRDFRSAVAVHLVETQRLFTASADAENRRIRSRQHSSRFASTVKNYSSDLESRIAGALTTYAEHSQALDRSFPQRMLGGPHPDVLDTNDLKDRMNQLEQRRSQLKQIGLIEDDTSYPFDINTLDSATPTQQAVMTLYVEDTENKLSVLDELEEKVDLLLGNINRKFKPNKTLRADRTSGLLVRDRNNDRIDLDSLSSGEQHELVLIYDLLFQVKPHSLVLIDEPELSLHVTWQKAFLKELFAIVQAADFDVLLATHSPFIVSDRVDLMVPLALASSDHETIRRIEAAAI